MSIIFASYFLITLIELAEKDYFATMFLLLLSIFIAYVRVFECVCVYV